MQSGSLIIGYAQFLPCQDGGLHLFFLSKVDVSKIPRTDNACRDIPETRQLGEHTNIRARAALINQAIYQFIPLIIVRRALPRLAFVLLLDHT